LSDRRFHPRWTIARRDLAALSREKTIVLALVIQLFVAGFSSFLVVGLTALYDPGAVQGDPITVGISGDAQEELVAAAEESENVRVERYADREAALGAFDEGTIDAVVTGQTIDGEQGTRIEVAAIAPAEDLRTTLIVVSVREYLSDVETAERLDRTENLDFQPVEVPPKADASQFFGFTYTILIPLLLFLPAFISGSIAVDSVTEELERGTLELLRVSPVELIDIVDGKAVGMIALAPLQAGLWIALLRFNGIGVKNPLSLLVFVAALTTVTVVVGIVLGLLTGQRRQAQLLYSMLVLLLFGAAVVLPQHPAATAATLAVGSETATTLWTVAAAGVVALLAYVLTRMYVHRLSPESL
jgi:ABC-type Na+ efflux pump permease subunit